MLRTFVKNAFAAAVSQTGSGRALARRAGIGDGPVVLGYHRVVADRLDSQRTSNPAMMISRQMLERHVDHIGKSFEFISLDEAAARWSGRSPSARPAATITFDDGYRDVYENALPLLCRKGIPAAVFVVTGLVGSKAAPVHDRLYLLLDQALQGSGEEFLDRLLAERGIHASSRVKLRGMDAHAAATHLLAGLPQAELLQIIEGLETRFRIPSDVLDQLRPVDWPELAEMQAGGFTIGSHTETHALLPNEEWDRVARETRSSRSILERRLGTPVRHFAYPDGRFSPAAVRAVEEAGYSFAYTTCLHRDPVRPWLTIPRKGLWEQSALNVFNEFSPSVMTCHMSWTFDLIRSCQQNHTSPAPWRPTAGEPLEGEL